MKPVDLSSHSHFHRPPRLGRLFDNIQSFYFITFNTRARAAILANDEIHAAVVNFCRIGAERHAILVGRYVLMPDHVHLFASMPPAGDVTLGNWVKALKTVLGKTLLGQDVRKPHWQEGFFDHVLRNAESYGQKWEYVRLNPVRAALVAAAEDWRYQGEIVALAY